MAAWQLFLSLPSQSFLIKSNKSHRDVFKILYGATAIFTYAFVCFSFASYSSKPPKKLPFFQLHRPAWYFVVFFSFIKWLYKSDLKFCWHVRNTMRSRPSTLDIIGQFRPSVCLSLLPVCRYQWYFQVCLPHYSLLIYFLLGLCSANANDFSKQSASYWQKKKKIHFLKGFQIDICKYWWQAN